MEDMTLGKVVNAVSGQLLHAPRSRKISGVSIDSRQILPGQLFVALRGERVDGQDYAGLAVSSGAGAVLCERPLPNLPQVLVSDSRKALGDLAGAYRQQFPGLRLAAVTGSSGKTATKEMLAVILGRRESILESRGNNNNDLGLPLTLLRLTSKLKLGVVEMGMNAPGEIRRLARLARPLVGIITNIGDAHLGRFRSKQALVTAKLELLAELPADGIAVLNADDPHLAKAARGRKHVITFGQSPQAHLRIGEVAVRLSGTHFILAYEGEKQSVRLGVLGAHQAWNAAAAVAGAVALGQPFKTACRALEGFHQKTPMRLELLRVGQHRVLNDAYNSNPQSAAKALELLAELPSPGRKFFVAGSMLELGAQSAPAHHALGRLAAQAGVQGLITVGEEARGIAVGARQAGGMEWIAKVDSAEEVFAWLKLRLSVQGDLILIKGSRRIGLEAVVEEMKRWLRR
ncbi:MAG: UDP-N-acetylmuramoyl-tripeptide--D-alanyl-D-alanine ligase [candidate division FCPU426 bacterium]